jgi:riboflavin synthase
MFTGLIEETGTVIALTGTGTKHLTIRTSLAQKLKLGDSIAVNGTCLTAVEITPDSFSADLLEETLARTMLNRFEPGRTINLELPTAAGTPLGGHIVQGHVEAVGTVTKLERESGNAESWRLAISVPESLRPYVIEKGSIAIDGISLTVAAVTADGIEVSIIPHTYAVTNIHTLGVGDQVNLETDPLAKYAAQRLASRKAHSGVTLEHLIASGY